MGVRGMWNDLIIFLVGVSMLCYFIDLLSVKYFCILIVLE